MRSLALIISLAFAVAAAAQPKAKPTPVSGESRPGLAAIDKLMLDMLEESSAPGAAIAIAKDGRLVYARGFGYCEPEKKTAVQPTALFRTASVSKPITVAAVCQLAERGKLRFEDKVFDLLKLKEPSKMDPRWKEITVFHLLAHMGGFDSERDGDPMFRSLEIARELKVPPPAKQEQIIRYVLTQPLAFAPGSKVCYSNFGYCLLGRVIEKAVGKPYDRYVIEELLQPLGIRDMQLGKTLTTAKGEVRYLETDPPTAPSVFPQFLGKEVPTPYGAWCLEAMDSHGGWLASAVDLARFGAALDDTDRFAAVKGKHFDQAFFPEYRYTGAFSGTSAMFHHAPGKLSYGIVFNSRKHRSDKNLCDVAYERLKKILDDVKTWPDDDLFPRYLK
jgi:N-acyl-D-amino-acid deacylase